jgi:hypothetical protein
MQKCLAMAHAPILPQDLGQGLTATARFFDGNVSFA